MVSADREQPIPLEQAGSLVPGGVARSTLFRWRSEGFKRLRLKTVKQGGRRMVYPSEIAAFLEATAAASDSPAEPEAPLPIRTKTERRAAARQAGDWIDRYVLGRSAKKRPPEEVSTGGNDRPPMQGAKEEDQLAKA